MQAKLELFFKWGIDFDTPYEVPEREVRPVQYASAEKLEVAIVKPI